MRKILKNIIDALIALECRFVKTERHTEKRLLILRKDTLGDYVLFYPTLATYRKAYSDAEISLVVSELFRSLEPLLKYFDNVIWYNARKYSHSIFYRRRFLLDLKKAGYDIAIQPTFSREPAGDFMIKCTGAPITIGIDGDLTASTELEKIKNDSTYTKLISVPESAKTELSKNIHIAEAITGRKINIQFPTISLTGFSSERADIISTKYGLTTKPYAIISPGSGTAFKIWPRNKFAKITDYISSKGFTPVFCGSKSEKPLITDIISKMSKRDSTVDLSGETDLPTVLHLLSRSKFYFGSDTGTTHLAAAIGTPSLCIMGGGHFGKFFPYGDLHKNRIVFDKDMRCKNDNWACSKRLPSGKSAPCISSITVADVEIQLDSLIRSL